MKYICIKCGKLLEDADAILNPDDEINCSGCYDSSDFFEEDEPEEENLGLPEYKPTLDYNGQPKKKSWLNRNKEG